MPTALAKRPAPTRRTARPPQPDPIGAVRARIYHLYDQISAAEKRTLADALDLGDALWQVREMIPQGKWTHWCRDNLPFGAARASSFMRLASFRRAIESSEVTTAKDAHLLLDALDHRLTRPGRASEYPPKVKKAALDMRAEGAAYRTIQKELGIPSGTLTGWLNPEGQRKRSQAQVKRKQDARRAKEALAIREREKAIYATKDNPLVAAYRTTARACKQMDAALETAATTDEITSYRAIRSTLGLALDRLAGEILGSTKAKVA